MFRPRLSIAALVFVALNVATIEAQPLGDMETPDTHEKRMVLINEFLEHGADNLDVREFRRLEAELLRQTPQNEKKKFLTLSWSALKMRFASENFTVRDLLEFYSAKRSAIDTLHVTALVTHQSTDPLGVKNTLRYTNEYAQDGAKTLVRKRESGREATFAYDGDVLRSFFQHKDEVSSAGIQLFQGRAGMTTSYSNVLFYAMLVDSVADFGLEAPQNDLAAFVKWAPAESVFVSDEPVQLRGASCLLISQPGQDLFIDIDRDFALIRYVGYHHGPDGELSVREQRDLFDYKDFGNSVWLPARAIEKRYDQGVEVEKWEVSWDIHIVNERIGESVFSDVIPEGALVNDTVKGQSYYLGKHGSIAGMLKDKITTPRTPINWKPYLLITNIVVVIVALLILIRRRGSKNAC